MFDKCIEFIKNRKKVIIILFILCILISCIIFYFMTRTNEGEIKYEDFVLLEGHKGVVEKYNPAVATEGYKGEGGDVYYITGDLKSNTDKKSVVIRFEVFDIFNKSLGEAVSAFNEMEKGKTYHFRALALVSDSDVSKIDHYKIKEIG